MKEIHVHPTAYIKPDFDKKIRVVLAAPGYIPRLRIKIAPEHLISTRGADLSDRTPNRINPTFRNSIDYATDPQIVNCGIS